MKTILITLLLIFVYVNLSFAQDTAYKYYNMSGREINKDSAYSYAKIFKQEGFWAKKEFLASKNTLLNEGYYLDNKLEKKHGTFKSYWNGTISTIELYENNKIKKEEYFYEGGKKKAQITYTSNGRLEQGWDENGVEIPNYIFGREAKFPGGIYGWKAYMESKLDPLVATRSNAPIGVYTVKIQFIVDKEGNITNVKALEVPEACKPCGEEAVKIIKKAPKWEPAYQYGKPVLYQGIQYLSWQVSGG